MSWLDDFLTAYNATQSNGVPVIQRQAFNFLGAGVSVADDPSTKTTAITVVAPAPGTAINAKIAATTNLALSGVISGAGVGDIVLATGQTSAPENGLWTVALGTWTRTSDAIVPAMLVGVQLGANRGYWVLATSGAINVGTTPLSFIRQADTYNVQLFGAAVNGSTDDTAAVQTAHDALPATGGDLLVPNTGLACVLGAVAISKATRIKVPPAGLTSNGVDAVMFTRTANFHIEGHGGTTVISPKVGGTAILFRPRTPTFPGDGKDVVSLKNVVIDGGDHAIDTFGVGFVAEGLIELESCTFSNTTNYAIRLDSSVYYGYTKNLQFTDCFADEYIRDNTETKTSGAIHKPAVPQFYAAGGSITAASNVLTVTGLALTTDKHVGCVIMLKGAGPSGNWLKATIVAVNSGSTCHLDVNATGTVTTQDFYLSAPSILCVGTHHVQVTAAEFLTRSPSLAPDIRVMATADGANGMLKVLGTKFGAERMFWSRSDHYAIEVYHPAEPSDRITSQLSAWCVDVTGCDFLGPQPSVVTSVTRASGVTTATLRCIALAGGFQFGHGLQIGDEAWLTQFIDGSFNGKWPVTAVGAVTGTGTSIDPWLQTVTVTNAGSDVSPTSSLGGDVLSASTSAVGMLSPAADMTFDGNTGDGYAHAIDCDTASTTEGTFIRDQSGRCSVGPNNHWRGPNGLGFEFFKNGRRGSFSMIEPNPGSPDPVASYRPRDTESIELRNRIAHSEALDSWGNAGITVTTGQTDPFGTTRAQKLARTGVGHTLGDGSGNAGLYPNWGTGSGAELIATAIDTTGTPVNGVVSFWAKSGTAKQIIVITYDGTYGHLRPCRAVSLTSVWTKYQIPFSYNKQRGALSIGLSPGAFDIDKGDCYVFGVQVSDVESDYYPTTSAAAADTTSGLRLDRRALLSGGADLGSQKITSVLDPTNAQDAATKAYVDSVAGGEVPAARTLTAGTEMTGGGDLSANRTFNVTTTQAAAASTIPKLDASSRIATKGIISSGTAPTISNVSATIGTGGTVTLDPGSNDQAGTIIINTGTGSPQYYVTFRLSWSTTLPGNAPVIQLTLADGATAWGSGNAHFLGGAHVIADGSPNAQISVFANNEYASSGLVTDLNFTVSTTYKIHYTVTLK